MAIYDAFPTGGKTGYSLLPADPVASTGKIQWSYDVGARFNDLQQREIHVDDYGAVGDGVTDDRDAIRDAMGALIPGGGGQPGGKLMFAAREYMVSDFLDLPSGITVSGPMPGFFAQPTTGRARVFMQSGVDAPVFRNASAFAGYNTNIVIENLWIDGPDTGGGPAVHLQGTSNTVRKAIVRNCLIRCETGTGLYLNNVQESIVECNTIIRNGEHAIHLDNCFDNLIFGNSVDTYDAGGSTDYAGDGIVLTGVSPNNEIVGNFAFLCNRGIAILDGNANVVSANRVNTNQIGILLQPQTEDDLDQVAFNTITGNVAYDNVNAGIYVDDDAAFNAITGNVSVDKRTGGSRTQLYGIRLIAGSIGNVVAGNVCQNNVNGQILNAGSNRVHGNQDDDAAFTGLSLYDGQPIRIGTSSGSIIGQPTSKIGLWGATPVSRTSGWTALSGTATKGGFATSTVTTEQLAQVVKAMIDWMFQSGYIGA